MNIGIYGSGGFARELAWMAENLKNESEKIDIKCFIDDSHEKQGQNVNQLPIRSLEDAITTYNISGVAIGIGSPQSRHKIVEKCQNKSLTFPILINQNVDISRFVDIGEGTVICSGCIITTNIVIGKHVQINLDCTIGHDVKIGDFTTFAPGVHLSGCVHVGKNVYIGTGATIINGTADNPIIIEDNSVIGAGACVTKNVESGSTVVGVPAKLLVRK